MDNQQEFKTKYIKEGLSTQLLSKNEYLNKYINNIELFLDSLTKTVSEQAKITNLKEWKVSDMRGVIQNSYYGPVNLPLGFRLTANTLYAVNKQGEVLNTKTRLLLLPSIGDHGRYKVSIGPRHQTGVSNTIHRLLAETYMPCEGMEHLEVNHKDCNRLNNCLSNLEWTTPQENREQYLKYHSKKFVIRGENHSSAKHTEKEVCLVRDIYLNHKVATKDVANYLGFSPANVKKMISGFSWSHVLYRLDECKVKIAKKQKYSELPVSLIKESISLGVPYYKIAEQYNVSRESVSKIASSRCPIERDILNSSTTIENTLKKWK